MSGTRPRPQADASPHGRRDRAHRAPAPDALSPADRYQELFVAVQQGRVFDDSKTFVDCAPLREPQHILQAYRAECTHAGFDLRAFVHAHFRALHPAPSDYQPVPDQPLREHVAALWPVLTRHPAAHPPASSLLQLPQPYVVPGGRFGELYYWDSYFTMLGLAADGQTQPLADMVENFAYLIDTWGHVPNGTRSYYLSRSQPPVFALMVELAQAHGACTGAVDFLPQLRREHAWWMRGADAGLAEGEANERVVHVRGAGLLNRHWDARDTPREEAWLEDVTTAHHAHGRPASEVYRHLRAACESGWDFSTRWLREPPASAPGGGRSERAGPFPSAHPGARSAEGSPVSAASLTSICTTDIVPVDLNAFMLRLERLIERLSAQLGDQATATGFGQRAEARTQAMHRLMWNDAVGAFFDWDWTRHEQRSHLTAACAVPLFVGLATPAQAQATAHTLQRRLLSPGGLATTEHASDQQWDRPNGWAPLQWMAVQGLRHYGQDALAQTIAHRWLCTVAALYEREGRLVEKYALRHAEADATQGGDGGEYPLQDGFGWTNGVTAALLAMCPEHTAQGSHAGRRVQDHR